MADRASKELLTLAVENERKSAIVRSLDLSFNELADMYATGELTITPEYQRTFRWSVAKQSQFLESIVLEMPVPPIYAVEVGEGKWELIDGLQRLSTYLHCRGELDLPENDIVKGRDYLTFEDCDIVPQLNGYTFAELTTSLQYRIRRATLRVELVRQSSNPRFAFYMFKRLNTGGEPLSNQEARNCSIRLLGPDFINFIVRLAQQPDFLDCVEDVTDEARSRMFLEELVLRFFAFKNRLDEYVHDIDPFLTRFMELVTDQGELHRIAFDYGVEEALFNKTFGILKNTLGSRASNRWVSNRWGGGFSTNHYEAFSIGVAKVADRIAYPFEGDLKDKITNALQEAKKTPEMRSLTTGGGNNFRRLYERKINLVVTQLESVL